MISKPCIVFNNVSLRIDSNKSLFENFTFTITKNTITLLIGPTGSGKTSILKLIKGIIPYLNNFIISGSIIHNGEKKNEDNYFNQSLEIGYLFQDFNLQFVGSTVEQELVFSLENMGQPRKVIQERLSWFINKYPRIEAILQRNPYTLSGGELAQIVFISTIISDPDILLLDEPLENLDNASKNIFLDMVASYKDKKTILICTHDIEPFINIVDEIVVINENKNKITQYEDKNTFLGHIELYPWINLSQMAKNYYLQQELG
jgi:energy-coupling factor transport system ATP-binding protein